MDEKRQMQQELFQEFVESQKRRQPKQTLSQRPRWVLPLALEHIILVVIAVILLGVVSFSLGVERGKAIINRAEELTLPKLERQLSVDIEEPFEGAEVQQDIEKQKPHAQLMEEVPVEPLPYYTVQVASYLRKEPADAQAEKLIDNGYEAFVELNGKYYVVYAGRFKDKDQAVSAQEILTQTYPDCLIRKR
jgi:hypothetical protein